MPNTTARFLQIRVSITTRILACLLAAFPMITFALGWTGKQLDGAPCQGNSQGFGPYEYLRATNGQDPAYYQTTRIWEIDRIHYGKGIKAMQSEELSYKNARAIAHEFDYTLRAFPNHIGALQAISELEMKRLSTNKLIKNESELVRPFMTPPECYFHRAAAYQNKQPHIPLLHAIYLHRLNRFSDAALFYEKSIALDEKNPEAHYNYGLVLMKLDRYDEALAHAKKAYNLGHKLMGLKSQLQEKGKWVD